MIVGSLFAGFGGMDLGLEMAGMEVAWQVEKEEYAQRVLEKQFPGVQRHGDIRGVGKENLPPVDLIAGGFPCQPFSVAGKRRGTADDRHLWPEMLRVISELKPAWVIGENVTNIIPIFIDKAISDLEAEGYAVESFVLPAIAFDTFHRRDRIFIVGYPKRYASRWSIRRGDYAPEEIPQPNRSSHGASGQSSGTGGIRGTSQRFIQNTGRQYGTRPQDERKYPGKNRSGDALHAERSGPPSRLITQPWGRPLDEREFYFPPEPDVGRMADGVPFRVERLRGLGNAVVPQQAEFVGRLVMNADEIFKSLEPERG